ncbi:MAG: xanthine dehydrogenase family protein subunit M [Armatimonadota bacterium]|nr:xanthine dehydrogenase family protein subunit M [Armatimonadota bacterium]
MKPAPFLYVAPRTVEEAVALLQEHGTDAKLLAGGQSLMPLINMRLARPEVLVDLNEVRTLDYITEVDGEVRIGAMTRQRAVERSPFVATHVPLLSEALRWVGHPQIRNRGTIGGSLAHADPSAELPAVAAALDAVFVARGPDGVRLLAPGEFFVSFLTTALEPAEMLVEVRFAVPSAPAGCAFLELSRRHGDFALVGAAAVVRLDSGRCRDVRLALTGVGPTPVRVREVEEALLDQPPTEARLADLSRGIGPRLDPVSDIHASAEYRRHVAGVLARRALAAAAARAQAVGGGEDSPS